MARKQGLIKERIKKMAFSLLGSAVIATSSLGGGSACSKIEENLVEKDVGYSSYSQTVELEKEFEAVTGYRFENSCRLQHNNDQPIYVSISEEFSEERQTEIKKSLEHIFGILEDINDCYNYEIVDDVGQYAKEGLSTIQYNLWNLCPGFSGAGQAILIPKTTEDEMVLNNKNNIYYANDLLPLEKDKDFNNISNHELLHILGMKDIYEESRKYCNTYINAEQTYNIEMITPNDYKLLMAWYTKSLDNLTAEEKEQYIEECKQKIEAYTKKFYAHCVTNREERKADEYKIQTEPIEESDITIDFNMNQAKLNKITVSIEGDKYTATSYCKGQVIDICEGKAYNIDGDYFLNNIRLKYYLGNEGETFIDLQIAKSKQDQNYLLYDNMLGGYESCRKTGDLVNIDTVDCDNSIDYLG